MSTTDMTTEEIRQTMIDQLEWIACRIAMAKKNGNPVEVLYLTDLRDRYIADNEEGTR